MTVQGEKGGASDGGDAGGNHGVYCARSGCGKRGDKRCGGCMQVSAILHFFLHVHDDEHRIPAELFARHCLHSLQQTVQSTVSQSVSVY
jgi:hypothetical protein